MFFKRCIAAMLIVAMSAFYPFSYASPSKVKQATFSKDAIRHSEGHVAMVLFVKGEAYAQDRAKDQYPLKPKSKLFKGDMIVTKNLSLIQINFLDGSMVRLTGNGKMSIDQYTQDGKGLAEADLHVQEGDFAIMVKKVSKLNHRHDYSIKTEKAKVSFEGTFGQGKVDPDGSLDFTLIPETLNGNILHSQAKVEFLASGKQVSIASDVSQGPNHIIARETLNTQVKPIDYKKLSKEFGLSFSEKGGVKIIEASRGFLVPLDKEEKKQEKSQFNKQKEPAEKQNKPVLETDLGDEKLSSVEEDGQQQSLSREEKRQALLKKMTQKRGEEQPRRLALREKISKGELDAKKDLIEQPFFQEAVEEEKAALLLAVPVQEVPANQVVKEEPKPMFTGKQARAFIVESLEMMGFNEEKLEGRGIELDFSDVGIELDEELAANLFIEEDQENQERGSILAMDIPVEEETVGSSKKEKDEKGEDSHLGEDGSYLSRFARYYVDKATDRIESIPGQEGIDPVGIITSRTKEEFSRYFQDSLQRYQLGFELDSKTLNNIEQDMWREFNHFFLPYFVSEYKKVLDGVRDDDRFFLVGNPLDKIALIEQAFLKDMSQQVDVFSKDFFPSAFAFYTESFDRQRYQKPEDPALRGEDRVYISREFGDFPSFNYSKGEVRKVLDNRVNQDSEKFVGYYTNTREASQRSSVPFIQALNDLSFFEKEGDNPLIADDFDAFKDALKEVREKILEVEGDLNGDWKDIQASTLNDLKELMQLSLEKAEIASGNIPLQSDANKLEMIRLQEEFLKPMIQRLDNSQQLYIGLEEQEKSDLVARLFTVQNRMDAIDSFLNDNVIVKEETNMPPELKMDDLATLQNHLQQLHSELAQLEQNLHPEDPLVEVTKDFQLYTEIDSMLLQLEDIQTGKSATESLPSGKVFEGLSLAQQLLKMSDKMQGHKVNFGDLQVYLDQNLQEATGLDSYQRQIQVDLLNFLDGQYKQVVQLGGVIDQAILDLNAGEAFELPQGAIIDAELATFKQEAKELQTLIRKLNEKGFRIDAENQLDLLKLSKIFDNFKNRYNELENALSQTHPLKTAELATEGLGTVWEEMDILIRNIDSRLPIYARSPNSIDDTDPEFLNLRSFLTALDAVTISTFLDEKEGKSLFDEAAGAANKNKGLRPAGIKKGNLVVLNRVDSYIEDGEVKTTRELSYLGKALNETDTQALTGIKTFSSKQDEYELLPDLMTTLFAYAEDDSQSQVYETDAVIDFGSSSELPKGYINFFQPFSFKSQQDGEMVQSVPELEFQAQNEEQEAVRLSQPLISPTGFSGYEVKSVLVDQERHTYVEEGDLLMVLRKAPVPAGALLDMKAVLSQEALGLSDEVAALGFEGYELETYLVDDNTTVVKGQQVLSLVRSNKDIPVETQEITSGNIPEGYQVKTLAIPQNQASVVQEGSLVMVLEHQDPGKRGFFKDVLIRATQDGNFIGQELQVGEAINPDTILGEVTGLENIGESRILLAAEETGVFLHTLSEGDLVASGDNIGKISVAEALVFDDVILRAEKSGIYKGKGLQVGDAIDTLDILGEFIPDNDQSLEVGFLDEVPAPQTLLFGKQRLAAGNQSNPQGAMVYYFDESDGSQNYYQFNGFQASFDSENRPEKTPLKEDITSSLITQDIEFIGENEAGNLRLDGIALTADALGNDAQLISTTFQDKQQSLQLPPTTTEGGTEIAPREYYGFANGFLVNVNQVSDTMDSWYVSPSRSLYLPLDFASDGRGSFSQEGQLQLQTGVDYRFGLDSNEVNMVVDKEHVFTTFDTVNGKGLLSTFALPEFVQKDVSRAIISGKPNNVLWGAWDIEANTNLVNTEAVYPGMHNYFVAGTPTTLTERNTEVTWMLDNNFPVSNYEVMVGKSMIAREDLTNDAKALSSAGYGDFQFDFEDDTWKSMVYFADGYLLVGKGNQNNFSIKNTADEGVDVQGFNSANGGWTLVDLMQRPESLRSTLSNPSLVNQSDNASGIGGLKGFFAGDQMTEIVFTASEQQGGGDAVSLVGIGGFSGFDFNTQKPNMVGFIDGFASEEGGIDPDSSALFLNLHTTGKQAQVQNLELSQVTQDSQELDALLQVNPFIDAQSLSQGDGQSVAKHQWVEVRETFKTLEFSGLQSETISQRIIDGSGVSIGDTLLSASSGLEIMSTIDGTVFFHDGQVPGATLVDRGPFATVVAFEGGDIVDGLNNQNTRFSHIMEGGFSKGALTLSTQENENNPLGLSDPSGEIQEQGRVIVSTSTPTIKHIPELIVEYRVKVDELVSSEAKNDRPFYVRFLFTSPDGREYVVELPKLDVSGVDVEGYVDYYFDSASNTSGDVTIYDTEGLEGEKVGNLAGFLDENAADTDLRQVLSQGLITEVSLVFGGDTEVSGDLHIDHITIKNSGKDEFAIQEDFEDLLQAPQELIFLNKDAFYLTPTTQEEARLYLPAIQGMDPVENTGFIATLKGLEDFEYLSFGLWRSQYQKQSDLSLQEAHGFFAVGDANHVYTRSDHERYLEALRQFNLPQNMQYSGLSIGSVYGPNRDGRVQVGQALLNINMATGSTSGSIQLGPDVIDLQTGSLQELRQAFGGGQFSTGMGFSGSAELRINGAAASGRSDLGNYQGGLYGKYNSNTIEAAKEASGTFKARNAGNTHRATGAFGVKKN